MAESIKDKMAKAVTEEAPANNVGGGNIAGTQGDAGKKAVMTKKPMKRNVIQFKEFADAEGLNGDILVTERTDPGWVPLYPSCSGLLIERGSLLSHSAVVARELGLPTIIGVNGGLMSKLKTGDRVRIDASTGVIQILREEADA
jgi:phosphohistidine swiveling domain-containing protein